MEEDLVARVSENDRDGIIDIGQDPAQLMERASRDDDARLLDRVEDRDRLDRDPVVVGGRQRQLVAFEAGQDAGQDRSCFVARGGECSLVEGLLEDLLRDPGDRSLAGRLDGREVVGRDALDVRLEPAAPDVKRLAVAELEDDRLTAREGVDEICQEAGRHGCRAVRLDLARDPVRDPDLEVRRGQLEAGVLGLQQDVR